jgi:CubicO group peptidase (beta-lactamase class C family)
MKRDDSPARGGLHCRGLIALLFLGTACAQPRDNFDVARSHIREQLVEQSIPSIAVAVAHHGKIVWEEGFGWANREERIPATADTLYCLASVSKPITATGVMTLVQAGKIDLDQPLNNYLGNAKVQGRVADAAGATVRRVANHCAGLPTHVQFFYSDEPYRRPSYDETILRYGNLLAIPGERFVYSNLGYGILGYVAARVSGESYEDFMRDAVFRKLGMTHTSVGVGPGLERFQAIRYDETGAPLPNYTLDTPGASEVFSSAHDLVRFGMFHLKDHLTDQNPILSDASLDEMHRPTRMDSDEGLGDIRSGYGIGWYALDRPDGYRVLSHDGGMPGVTTILALVPSEDLAVVVLANAHAHIVQIENDIMKAVLPNWKIPTQQRQSVTATPSQQQPAEALLGTWNGTLHTYQAETPILLKVLPGGEAHVKLGSQPEALVD